MFYKENGTWKSVNELYYKESSSWKKTAALYHKRNGSWELVYIGGLPAEVRTSMIALFDGDTIPRGAQEANGENSTINLVSPACFLRSSASEGTYLGSDSHGHSYSGNTGGSPYWWDGSYSGTDGIYSHSHTMSHTHSAVSNLPPYYTVTPLMFVDRVTGDMIFFAESLPDNCVQDTSLDGSFIRCDTHENRGAIGGSETHDHPTQTFYTGYAGSWTGKIDGSKDGTSYSNEERNATHRHSFSHGHSGGNNIPEYYELMAVRFTGEFTNIPSGVIAFFVGTIPPEGWRVYTNTNNYWIRIGSNPGTTGGSNTHSHSISMNTSSYAGQRDYVTNNGNRTTARYGHRHSASHSHSGNNYPYSKEVMLCIKD